MLRNSAKGEIAVYCRVGDAHQRGALTRADRCSVGRSLRRFAVVVLQKAAQAGAASQLGEGKFTGLPFSMSPGRHEQFVFQALVRTLGMVVLDKLAAEVIYVPLTENHEIIEAFLLDALNESLDEGHGIRGPEGRSFGPQAGFFQRRVEAGRELAVPIVCIMISASSRLARA